jgi:phosphoenolpyruvate synthase/pyruvate phosphate dikinase
MFMAPERLPVVQRMIMADSGEARAEALAELLPMQQADFAGLFRAMDGLPVTIRLMDPPLHDFLPDMERLSESLVELKGSRGRLLLFRHERLDADDARSAATMPRASFCGENGVDKESIFFCYEAGLDSISCSPYRVPLACLVAAQAQIALGNPAARRKVVREDAVS